MKKLILSLLFAACVPAVHGQGPSQGVLVAIRTNMGDIVVRLFDDTPLHRDNFMENVRRHCYDSSSFHRVIDRFMIQGGAPNPAVVPEDDPSLDNKILAEFVCPAHFHRRGMLCAARENDVLNPAKASSPYQFYIVTGKPFMAEKLDRIEQDKGIVFTAQQRETYMGEGGAPSLDWNYTVFGEVVSGMDVVDRIGKVPTGEKDRPLEEVVIIKAELLTGN